MTSADECPHKYKLVRSTPSFTGSKWPRLRRFLASFFTWSFQNSDIIDASNNKVVLKLAEVGTRNTSILDSDGKFVLRPLRTKDSSVLGDSPILQYWSWLDPKPNLWPVYSIVDKSGNILGAYNGIVHDRLSYFGPEIYPDDWFERIEEIKTEIMLLPIRNVFAIASFFLPNSHLLAKSGKVS